MNCCHQVRAALTEHHRMRVRYSGGRPVLVKGPVTGNDYRFSGVDRLQIVDPRDAIALVRNPLFRIEGVIELPVAEVASLRDGGDRNA
jgi:hypothetical protein